MTCVGRVHQQELDRRKFNDFMLIQGILPPALLKKAVEIEFIPRESGAVN